MHIDNINEFVLALKNISIEYKGQTPKFIANEIYNHVGNLNMSDRESPEQQTGVRDNMLFMSEILKSIPNL